MPVLLLVGGGQLRDFVRAGTARFTLNQDVELYLMRAAGAQALFEGAALEDVQKRFRWDEYVYRFGYVSLADSAFSRVLYAEQYPETAGLSLPGLARVYFRRGLEILCAHLVETAMMQARGLAFLLLVPPNVLWQHQWGGLASEEGLRWAYFVPKPFDILSWLRRHAPGTFAVAVACIAALAALAGLAVRGSVLAGRERAGALLVASLVGLALVTAGPSCLDDRYRVPLMPFLCLLAPRGLTAGKAG